jgi:CBS domain-containing protein
MAIRVLGKTRAMVTEEAGDRFVGVREVTVPLGRDLWADEKDDVELLASVALSCQRGGTVRSGIHCLSCERFVHCTTSPDGERAVVHCFWDHTDRVSDLMTRAAVLVTVPREARIEEAIDELDSHAIRHLPVLSRGDMVGIISAADLERAHPGDQVGQHMRRAVWIIPPEATLADAAALMRREGVGCLPVVAEGVLVGLVTRGDLRRAGLPERILGAA